VTRNALGAAAPAFAAAVLASSLLTCGGSSSPAGPAEPTTPGPATGSAFTVHFDVDSSSGHPISPYIYGTNQGDWSGASRHLTLGRLGGNRLTAYNWENNASNAGNDYLNQNDDFLGGGDVAGEVVRKEVAATHAAGASCVVTVPIQGYVAADKNGGGDVAQTPDYLNGRFRISRARKGSAFTYPPDTTDRFVYQDELVHWLEGRFPESRRDPRRTIFYDLDNEPDLWFSTHSRIHPDHTTFAEMVSRTSEYASAIKDVAPDALVFGFVSYGWNGYTTLQDAPDRNGRDFIDFFLDSMKAAQAQQHRRLLDVLDLHWYPEARGGGVRITENDDTAAVAAARVQAPRSLWDPTYVETSWISDSVGAIRLLPRIRQKISDHYPGTRLAFTEYNYGGANHISGTIAHADVLGIFGREGVFAATLWGNPPAQEPAIQAAFDAYRNFDGAGGAFGDTSIFATTSDAVNTSIYGSVDSGGGDRVVLVAINKASGPAQAEISVRHDAPLARARVYRITAVGSPARATDIVLTSGNGFSDTLPPSSVTTYLLTP
jgi:Glycoside hydrolase family 44